MAAALTAALAGAGGCVVVESTFSGAYYGACCVAAGGGGNSEGAVIMLAIGTGVGAVAGLVGGLLKVASEVRISPDVRDFVEHAGKGLQGIGEGLGTVCEGAWWVVTRPVALLVEQDERDHPEVDWRATPPGGLDDRASSKDSPTVVSGR